MTNKYKYAYLAVLAVIVVFLANIGAESVIPPVVAIGLALITKEVLFSLAIGILGGSMLHTGSFISGAARVFDTYIVEAMTTKAHASIIIFSMTLGGMVGVISRSGGTRGIVKELIVYAKGPRSGQLATWFMGLFIFFDDYANTLVVGNTMRPLTDKLKISREKLAYIVDSTAAPVASLALISTWIGYEVSLIDDSFMKCGITNWTGYSAFLESIPYRFYCILTLVMVFLIALLGRDFGPMAEAEKRCRTTGKALADDANPLGDFTTKEVEPPDDTPHRWYNAIIPIVCLILMTIYGLHYTGSQAILTVNKAEIRQEMRKNFIEAEKAIKGTQLTDKNLGAIEEQLNAAEADINHRAQLRLERTELRKIVSNADSSAVLLWSSFTCSILAILLPLIQGIGGSFSSLIAAWVSGATSMVMASMILVLAWSLGTVCANLGTADYIAKVAITVVSPWILPGLTFVIAAAMAFATGTSWGTLSIVLPLVIPLAHKMGISAHLSPALYESIVFSTIGAVLSGACFGDHCSPISDTTIMSSMASGCDHVDHVKTQLPYALVAAAVAILLCYVPSGIGVSPIILLPVGIGAIAGIILFLGEKSDIEEDEEKAEEG
jgi:Na+/H+ antiporter NhaC